MVAQVQEEELRKSKEDMDSRLKQLGMSQVRSRFSQRKGLRGGLFDLFSLSVLSFLPFFALFRHTSSALQKNVYDAIVLI